MPNIANQLDDEVRIARFAGKVQSAISPPDHCVLRMKNTFGSPEIAALVSTSVKSPDALKTFETTGVH